MNKTVIIIPARYGSTRLPAKPLLKVNNKPIIQYVYEAAKKSKLADAVIVATDDERIKSAVEEFGGVCEMTSAEHKCGSDRIAEVVSRHMEFDNILNLQGDEPQITPEVIDLAINALLNVCSITIIMHFIFQDALFLIKEILMNLLIMRISEYIVIKKIR